MFVPAFAKINLTLDVLGKRADGFHLLSSVMQTISLCDTLALTPRADATVTLACDVADLETAQNLALRAANLALATASASCGLDIELAKGIPTQAGLGGGSSDAAAVLVALNTMRALGHDDEALRRLGAELGSDVPFFVTGGTALIGGRGELVTSLPDAEPLWIVLVKPHIGLSTAAVFAALAQQEWTDGQNSNAVAATIRAGEPLPLERFSNALEAGVLRTVPEVAAARRRLVELGASVVRLSGSGPTLFAPFRQLRVAAEVARRAADDSVTVWLVRTVSSGEVARAQRHVG